MLFVSVIVMSVLVKLEVVESVVVMLLVAASVTVILVTVMLVMEAEKEGDSIVSST